jgi:hypothetical protein
MKRIKNPRKYKRYQRKRAKRQAQRRAGHLAFVKRRRQALYDSTESASERLTARSIDTARRARTGQVAVVTAPPELSMVANPELTIAFFHRVWYLFEQHKPVYVSLEEVRSIDHNALVVLLAILVRFKEKRIGFNGAFPRNKAAKTVLIRAKFVDILYDTKFGKKDTYAIGTDGSISTHAKRAVDSALTARMIADASRALWEEERYCKSVQRIFVELMQNTNNHASLTQSGEKYWWASSRITKKAVEFTFADFGIGVFRSLDSKGPTNRWYQWRTKMLSVFTADDNAELLRLILDGEMHQTVTGEYFRGKGLPGIKQVLTNNGVSRLVIVTNDVYADVGKDIYRILDVPFQGTLVYWELTRKNVSHPIEVP